MATFSAIKVKSRPAPMSVYKQYILCAIFYQCNNGLGYNPLPIKSTTNKIHYQQNPLSTKSTAKKIHYQKNPLPTKSTTNKIQNS